MCGLFTSKISPAVLLWGKVKILEKEFKVNSGWYSRSVAVRTYELEELLGTKLRALFQRRKGRDLLDLDYCLNEFPNLNVGKIIATFTEYLSRQGLRVLRAEFEENLFNKMKNETFLNDTRSLFAARYSFDVEKGYQNVSQKLLSQLHGSPWKGQE